MCINPRGLTEERPKMSQFLLVTISFLPLSIIISRSRLSGARYLLGCLEEYNTIYNNNRSHTSHITLVIQKNFVAKNKF